MNTSSSLPRKLHRYTAVICFALAPTVHPSSAVASDHQDDALLVTSACDEERSRATAKGLFEFVERKFASYAHAMPLEVKVLEDVWDDGRPPTFTHQAKFKTFDAAYYLTTGGKRVLQSLNTRSASFKLPFGLRMGDSKIHVLRALGPPTAISKKSFLYQVGGEAIHDVFFTFDQDRLTGVSWAYGEPD